MKFHVGQRVEMFKPDDSWDQPRVGSPPYGSVGTVVGPCTPGHFGSCTRVDFDGYGVHSPYSACLRKIDDRPEAGSWDAALSAQRGGE